MSCTLAVYDGETEYANHLMNYIKRKHKKLTVRVFTNMDSLREYLKHNPIQILLINENMPVEEIKQNHIKNICILSEDNCSSGNAGYPVIYKFQSAETLMRELFSYYPLQEVQGGTKKSFEHTTEIISVFSVDEGVSRQVFAFSLANQYAVIKKTLYVNFDVFPVLPVFLGHKAENGLSEFIYYLKQNPSNLTHKMNGIITKRNNLDYIEGVSFGPDLYELTAEDMNLWLSEIMRNTAYEVVVFGVGCYFHAVTELFRNTGRLLLLLGDNTWEQAKYHNFIEQLNWAGYEDITEKITPVPLPEEERAKLQSFTADNFDRETGSYDLAAQYLGI